MNGMEVLRLTLNNHCDQRDNTWMLELLQNTNFTKSGDRDTFCLIFHEDSFQSYQLPGEFVSSFMNFTAKGGRSEIMARNKVGK